VSYDLLLIPCEILLPALYMRVVIPTTVWHALQDPRHAAYGPGMGGPAAA